MEKLINKWNKLSKSEKMVSVIGIGVLSTGIYLFGSSLLDSIKSKELLGFTDGLSKASIDAEAAVRRGILSMDNSNKYISMAKIKHGIKFKKF